jgi:hypothetical protein
MDEDTPPPDKQFHGWRLIGVIMGVIFVLAIVSAIVDWIVVGPLEGRVF